MKAFFACVCVCAVVFISGCSSKKHFEPKVISGKIVFKDRLSAPIQSVSRQGAVLKDDRLVSFHDGVTNIWTKKGYSFLTQENNTYVMQSDCKDVALIERSPQGENMRTLPFESCILSASLKGNKLALVFMNNTLMYYDVDKKEEIFSQKYPDVVAINSYLASPLISDEYVIFPDLEGKILVYSIAQNKIIKDILVSSDKFFNNIIYLYARGDYLLGATAKRISAIINDKSFKYDVELRDMLFYKDKIYVLTIEGEILELDHTLKLLRKVRLPFAVLSGIVIQNDTLYTLEKGGYVIALDLGDFTPLVYTSNLAKKKSLFYNKDTMFYDKVYKRFE